MLEALWNVFCPCVPGVLDIPMISWVVMLVSRLLDYVASVEDEASGAKKHLGGKERERPLSGEPGGRVVLSGCPLVVN